MLAACDGGDGGGGGDGSCDESLKTGIVAQQTGISADSYDCAVLASASKYGEPDPMLLKATMYGESRFDNTAVGCTNLPCGQPAGWTTEQTGCIGLMQVVLACGGSPNNLGLDAD